MSLIDQVQRVVAELVDCNEIYMLDDELSDVGIEAEESGLVVDERRWYVRKRSVFGRNGEYVAVYWNEGSTELQDDGIELDVNVQRVVAVPAVKYVAA